MNRYKFQSRPEELQQTDVRITTELSKESTRSLEDILSLDPDTSSSFREIKKVLYPLSASLPLLIYNLPEVVRLCLKKIQSCPQSILQILSVLAREVRQELSPYFPSILEKLIELCEQNNLLEQIFSCISICLKYLIKTLDCSVVMDLGFKLIQNKDAGIRHLASQSFAFIARKDLGCLEDAVKKVGESCWELCKFAANQFFVERVLKVSWENFDVARKLHLSLAYDKKFEKEVWDSIVEHGGWSVLVDWGVMCNGTTFPKMFLPLVNEICKENNDGQTMSYFIKYHQECFTQISWVLNCQVNYTFLKIISDYQDPRPEKEVHEHVQKNSYENKPKPLDFREYSSKIFSIIDNEILNTGKEALYLTLHLFQTHLCSSCTLNNLEHFISNSIDEEGVWLGVRVLNFTLNTFNPVVKVSNEFIQKEIGMVNKQFSDLNGENLWVAGFLHPEGMENVDIDIEYLLHPALRIPACQLLQKKNNFSRLAWDVVQDSASLQNERHIITNLKRLEHYFEEDPKQACYFLLGLFWERFSTLWKHIISSLSILGSKHGDHLWPVLFNLLETPPSPPTYPEYYQKYTKIRDWAPVEYLHSNLIQVLISCPALINTQIDSIKNLFLHFFNTEYLNSTWVPLYPLPQNIQGSKPTNKLTGYLKVLSLAKQLKRIPEKAELKKIFLSLCCDKNEETRKLAIECIFNLKLEEFQFKPFLRAIARDEGFKENLVVGKEMGIEAAVALCAARVLVKSVHTVSALNFISAAVKKEFLLELLPVELKVETVLDVLKMPTQFVVGFLRTLRSLIVHCFLVLPDPIQIIKVLLALHSACIENSREIAGKTLNCIAIAVTKFEYPDDVLQEILTAAKLVSESSNFRPKVLNLVYQIVKNYSSSHVFPSILNYLLTLLNTPKLDSPFIHKTLDCLQYFSIPTTSFSISALTKAITQVSYPSSILSILTSLTPGPEVTFLASKLIKPSSKKPELREILKTWIPFCAPPPVSELTNLVLKNEEFIPLLAVALQHPDNQILAQLSATRKKGLITEKCYDSQLSALHDIKSFCFNEPKAVVASLSHLVISQELGIRTAAGNAFLYFCEVNGIEDILSVCIKRCRDEEQIRSVLHVWNRLGGPLTSSDPDLSQVTNLAHLQIHRRIRALTNGISAPVSLLKKLFIPIIIFYMFKSTSKQNYQQNFYHSLSSILGEMSQHLSWRDYYKLLKVFINEFETDEHLVTKTICSILLHCPNIEKSARETLVTKILPKLKVRITDKKDKRRPLIRKYVVAAIYKILSLQPKESKNIETGKLLMILSKEFKGKEEDTRDSVIKAVSELLKVGCEQKLLLKEFNYALEPELFALFLTRILKTDLIKVNAQMLPVMHQVLLEYEQYSSYYYLSKNIDPTLLPSLLASTRTLQFISQGLAENKLVTAENYISLGLSLLSHQAPKAIDSAVKNSAKIENFCIQPGAASGTRPRSAIVHSHNKAEKIFGIRLLKTGIKKSVELDSDIRQECKQAVLTCLDLEVDEAVITALDLLKIIGDTSDIPAIISVSERAGEEVIIHSLKALSALIRSKSEAESVSASVLPQVLFSLQSPEVQSSALKLLKIFVTFKVFDELIYDSVEELPRIILSNSTLTSQVCQLYIQFLVTYPLSDKRKNYHLDFLVKNIGCLNKDANEVIVSAIDIVLEKLPYEALKDYYDFLLLSLLTSISNEEIPEYREKYLTLATKTFKLNQNSTILPKILNWLNSSNKSLSQGCLRFISSCTKLQLLDKNLLKSQILPKILKSEPCRLSLDFLIACNSQFPHPSEILDFTIKVLKKGENLSIEITDSLASCTEELLETALVAIQNDTFTEGITQLIAKAEGEKATRKVSAVCRKLFGKGIEGDRLMQMLNGLVTIARKGEFDRRALIKTLLVFSKCTVLEVKEVIQEVFKELHVGKSQEEFLKEYSEVRDKELQIKEGKKAKRKMILVTDPELAARLKQKKAKKSKLLKKKKMAKFSLKKIKTS